MPSAMVPSTVTAARVMPSTVMPLCSGAFKQWCLQSLPATSWKPYQSHNMRVVLRIPAPSSILQAFAKPQHARSATDSSPQHDVASSIKATTSTESCGFQLPAALCKPSQSHNIHGCLRIPAPSTVLHASSKPQHARMPTDSSS